MPNKKFWISIIILSFIFCNCLPVYARVLPQKGWQKEYFSNGKLFRAILFKNGLFVKKIVYFKNGKVSQFFKYSNGMPYFKKNFYPSGQLKSVWTRRLGKTKYYDKEGRLKAVISD